MPDSYRVPNVPVPTTFPSRSPGAPSYSGMGASKSIGSVPLDVMRGNASKRAFCLAAVSSSLFAGPVVSLLKDESLSGMLVDGG